MISQTAWRRSVGKQFHNRRPGEVSGMDRESVSALIGTGGADAVVWAEASAFGNSGRTGFYAVLEAAGNVAAGGAVPAGLSARIVLPAGAEEEELRSLAAGVEEACSWLDLQAACVQGEVSPAVRCPVITVTAAGSIPHDMCGHDGAAEKDAVRNDMVQNDAVQNGAVQNDTVLNGTAGSGGKAGRYPGIMYPGQEIILCGYAGLEGTLRILDEAEEELSSRFVPSFLAGAKALKKDLVTPEVIRKACSLRKEADNGQSRPLVTAVRQIGSGGLLAALWDMAELSGTGIEVDMHCMQLKQETVEVCEYFRLNPYQMTSAGSFLLAADHADEVIGALEGAGARAGRLGVARAQNARVITSGEETRYLDRPAPDELIRWWEERLSGLRVPEHGVNCNLSGERK